MKTTTSYITIVLILASFWGCKKHTNVSQADSSKVKQNAQALEQSKDKLKEIAEKGRLNLKKTQHLASEIPTESVLTELKSIQENSQALGKHASDTLNRAKSLVEDINSFNLTQTDLDEPQQSLLSEARNNFASCQTYFDEAQKNLQEIKNISAQINQNQRLKNNSSDSNKAGLSYRFGSTTSNYGDINNIPSAPELTELPQGVFSFEKSDSNNFVQLGVWRQIEGTHNADFLPGSYTENIWAFRSDSTVEIKRTYGKERKIKMTWIVRYIEHKDSQDFTILNDPNYRLEIPFTNSDLKEYGILLEPPVQHLPIRIERKLLTENRAVLSDRVFEKLN